MPIRSGMLGLLSRKKVLLGTGIHVRDPIFSEMLGEQYDFLWIDMEHTWLDKGHVLDHIIACRAAGAASVVRIPWNDPVLAKPILEMGPDAIVFPQICNLKEARHAIEACLYPPCGKRGWGAIRARDYGWLSAQTYIKEEKERTFIIIQVENIECLEELDKIAELDGLGAICVGPMDMSASINKLTQCNDPEVVAMYDKMGEIMKRHDIPFMVSMGYNEEEIMAWHDRGVRIFHISGELQFIEIESKRQLSRIHAILPESKRKGAEQ